MQVRSLNRAPVAVHLMLLYSWLRRAGIEVSVFDAVSELGLVDDDRDGYLRRLAAALAAYEPDLVGVSCWTSFQYLSSLAVGRMLRELFPRAVLVVGGYHPTTVPDDFRDSAYDVVVRGPGEQALLDLCRASPAPRRAGELPAVVEGAAVPYDDVPLDWSFPYPTHGLFLSRGCPFGCLFCLERTRKLDCLRVERALAEYAEAARRSRDGFVHIFDACFGVDKRWRRAFLSGVAEARAKARPHLEVRLDLLDDEDIALLGATRAHVMFGIESGSPRMLRLMRKSRLPERYLARCREVLAACDAHGVEYTASILYNHPGETVESLDESIDFFWELLWQGPSRGMRAVQTHRFCYLPGMPLEAVLPELGRDCGARVHHPTWWRVEGDHRALSEAVTASRDLPLEKATSMANIFDVMQLLLDGRSRETPQ